MLDFTIRRLGQMALMLWVLSLIIFSLIATMPGDPVEDMIMSDPRVRPEDVERLRKQYGLDDPIHLRYGKWVHQLFIERDLGFSRVYKLPVAGILKYRIANTFRLMTMAFLISLVLSLIVGVLAARFQYSPFDYLVTFSAFVGISIPPFWLGIMTLLVCTVWLRSMGYEWFLARMPDDDAGFLEQMRYLIMPVGVLSFETIGVWSRYVRASLLEVLQEDYIRTARAKGLGEVRILFTHALRNALIPVVTVVALYVPSLFGGALITETVFAWPGMGRLLYESVIQTDFYVALVCFMILAGLTLFFNLVADLLYAYLDPRIRLS